MTNQEKALEILRSEKRKLTYLTGGLVLIIVLFFVYLFNISYTDDVLILRGYQIFGPLFVIQLFLVFWNWSQREKRAQAVLAPGESFEYFVFTPHSTLKYRFTREKVERIP
jgi:hypothetical protein